MRLRRRTRHRLKVAGNALLAAGGVAVVGIVVSVALQGQEPPPVSDRIAAAYSAGATLAPKASTAPARLGDVLPKLKDPQQEFVLTVIGDSTGFGPNAWVRQAVQRVADSTGRPTAIYDWDQATGAYGPVAHLGPAGKETLIVWNGSASGRNASYASEHLAAMLPQKSDLVLINHGHNSPALFNATEHLKRLITGVWSTASERAAIVVTAQNPRLDAAARVDAEVVAMTKAMPTMFPTISVLDAFAAFEAAGRVETLLAPDGLHPAAPGHKVWADAAVQMLGF